MTEESEAARVARLSHEHNLDLLNSTDIYIDTMVKSLREEVHRRQNATGRAMRFRVTSSNNKVELIAEERP